MIARIFNKSRTYGLVGSIRLMFDLISTKILFSKCRIIRRPYYFRNSGTMNFGRRMTTGVGLRIDIVKSDGVLVIGDDVQINDYCHIGVAKSVEIGKGTLIASKVFITDHQHGNISSNCKFSMPSTIPIKRPLSVKSVKIGENVWIGENVTILPGVKIGDGCIIGAGSVVTKSLPRNVIAAGIPAKIIKHYDFLTNSWVKKDCYESN